MLRIDPPVQGAYHEVKANETVGSTSLNPGDLVYADIASAKVNVSWRVPRLDNSSYGRLGARVCGTHNDRSFSSRGSLDPRLCLDQDHGSGGSVHNRHRTPADPRLPPSRKMQPENLANLVNSEPVLNRFQSERLVLLNG